MSNWNGKRVLILGAGRQGLASARWLNNHGALVTINDHAPVENLSIPVQQFAGIPVTWVFDGHPIELLNTTDILCISGGIPLDNPVVIESVRRGIPLTNDTQIFIEEVPCPTIGITGSAGKTTTTYMVGDMAKIPMRKRVFIGGNIGDPLLNYVDDMTADDIAIMEISSFQLEQMTRSPTVVAVLNITPNHLDRHGTMEAYTAAKKRILDFQTQTDISVLCRDDPGSWALRESVHGRMVSFGFSPIPSGTDGSYLKDGMIFIQDGRDEIPVMKVGEIQLLGEHNRMNTLAAFSIGYACNFQIDDMVQSVKSFSGVSHRLEFVREWRDTKWYNDSIATTPERVIAAIRSFKEPIILLLGGRDKQLPWNDLALIIRKQVDHVILFGEAAGKIQSALDKVPGSYSTHQCLRLKEAVLEASNLAVAGDVILFSPGGTSFDQFKDFEERGDAFKKWVSDLS